MATRSARMLSRHYAKLAIASAAPLVVLIIALAYIHYAQQRQDRLEAARDALNERYQHIQSVLGAASIHVNQMRHWAEGYLTAHHRQLSRLLAMLTVEAGSDSQDITGYFLDKNADELRPEATGNFIGDSLALGGGTDALRVVSLALEIFSIQQLGHVSNPAIVQSYFLPARGNFLSVYPAHGRAEFLEKFNGGKSGGELYSFFARAAYLDGTPNKDPKRLSYWTEPEQYAATGDKYISHAAPVYEGDRFIGIVGVDLSEVGLSAMMGIPNFHGASARITDEHGDTLATAGPVRLPRGLWDAVADSSGDAADEATDFVESNGYILLRLPLNVPGWHLDYALPASEVLAGLAWRFLPYGLILAGLIATLIFGQLLVRSQFVRPVLAFAQYIRDGARGEETAPPVLPRVWKPWVSMLKATFDRSRLAVELLRRSEERYRRLVELSPDAIMLHDRDGITFLNPAGCRVLGFKEPAEAYQCSYIDFVADDEKEPAAKRIADVMDKRLEIPVTERRIQSADGKEKYIEVMATPFIDEAGDITALVIFRDVRARKAMEQAVRDSEQRFRAISEAIPIPIIISDQSDLTLKYVNPAARAQLGIGGDLDEDMTVLTLCRDRSFRDKLSAVTTEARRLDSRETEVTRCDGERFWARVTTVPMIYEGKGSLIHAVVDLTERVRAEAELAQQRAAFHHKETIAALGSLLAGVAHELNNPLSVVTGQSLMLEEAASEDEKLSNRARRIRQAAERCSRIVRTFLAMARSRSPERGPIDLNAIVESALDLASYSLKSSGVDLTVDLAADLPKVVADGDQLHHVVSNLVVNAEHAMREVDGSRQLHVETALDEENNCVNMRVADSGPGIPEEIAKRIFEPFYTTKSEVMGTGIGLSLCRDIVSNHGGEIKFADNAPRGTVFTVSIPLKKAGKGTVARPARAVEPWHKGRVLVVDDDEEVAHTLADVLRMSGHEVDTVYSGEQGVERLSQNDYDVIISDVRMPGLDGPGLLRAIRDTQHDLDKRFLFMTGDTLGVDLSPLVDETGITVIEKPLDPSAVAEMVAERLSALRGDAAQTAD